MNETQPSPMRAFARLELPDGRLVDMLPGDILGRLSSAAIRVEDPRLSEAHALLSLRGDRLVLLSLRGVLQVVGGTVSSAIPLSVGAAIRLVDDLVIRVVAVSLPSTGLALRIDDGPPTILTMSVASIVARPTPRLVSRLVPDALAQVWSTSQGWTLRPRDGDPTPLRPGGAWHIDGVDIVAALHPLRQANTPPTRLSGRLHPLLSIVLRYDSVHIHRRGHAPLVLSGRPAQILSELHLLGGLARWEVAARQVWRSVDDPVTLRQRWDRNLRTLRKRLREADVREDLVRADGGGRYELFLLDGDEVVDDT